MNLHEITKHTQFPGITANFQGEQEDFTLTIAKERKKYRFVLNNGDRTAEFTHHSWREFPPQKFRDKAKALGYTFSKQEIENLCVQIINDEQSKWIDEWYPPPKEDKEYVNQEEAQELLKDPYILQKIRLVLDFKLAGLTKKKLGVFLALLSKNLKNPKLRVSPCVWGKWGEGKSYLMEKVLELFFCERMNNATESGVYRDSLENERYYDSKIVYFGDLGGELPESLEIVFDLFKQLVTEGVAVKKLVMKNQGDEEGHTEKLVLRGHPVIAWTDQTPPQDEQLLSRVLPIEYDISERQRKLVKEYSSCEYEYPENYVKPQEYKELERTVKTALMILGDTVYPVINPYARLINDCMSVQSPNVNRDRDKVFGIIAALTHLHQYQRETIKIGNTIYVVTDPVDILNALYLLGEEFKVLFGSLDSLSQTAYTQITEKMPEITKSVRELTVEDEDGELKQHGFTNSDLADWMNLHPKTAAEITKKLYKRGLLDRNKEGRSWKYYLLPQYDSSTKTNGNVLFDSGRMLEGIMGETELRKWLNRVGVKGFSETLYKIKKSWEDLPNIPTPEYKIYYPVLPLWEGYEKGLMNPPQTFDYLLNDSNVLDGRSENVRKEKDDSGGNGEKKEEPELKHSEKKEEGEIEEIEFREPSHEELIKEIKDSVNQAWTKWREESYNKETKKQEIKENIVKLVKDKYQLVDENKVRHNIERMHNEGEIIL